MFYTNFDPEKQTLSLMSAKIGGLHLAKNFLSIESEIKQSIAEEQPLETIMTKFAISISKLNIHTTDTIIQSVAEGKTQLIELIFAAGNNIPLQARVQLRYYFYVYLEELRRRASEENLQEILQEIIREISQEAYEAESSSNERPLKRKRKESYDGAVAVKFSFRHGDEVG